jgi:hypothetical protein
MRAATFILVAAALVSAAVAAGAADRGHAARAADRASKCGQMRFNACNATADCAWCGHGITPDGRYYGLCYDTTDNNATCCETPGPSHMPNQGNGAAVICHGRQQCHIDAMQSHYGTYYDIACCPRDLPVSCHGSCYAAGTRCCQITQCSGDTTCCDDDFSGGLCCAPGASCCGNAWNLYCCDKGYKCNPAGAYNRTTRCTK